jgi:hypothetical protein
MTAITSQTFHHHGPSQFLQRLGEVFAAGARWLAQVHAAPAAARRVSDDAEEVRALARSWERTDPGFAADLYAAAARHESQSDR